MTESFARWMGTPQFLLWMTVFVSIWLLWNTLMPEELQFDPRSLNFTLLTLMLSLQASYAAPLLLLAQNRQDDRDRVVAEEDRQRAQQNLADTEYLTREIAALRIALREVATRDFVRSEIRDLIEEVVRTDAESDDVDDSSDRRNAAKRIPQSSPASRSPKRPSSTSRKPKRRIHPRIRRNPAPEPLGTPMNESLLAALGEVIDPELRRPITEMGMVSRAELVDGVAHVGIRLTIEGCPLKNTIQDDVRQAVGRVEDVQEVRIDLDYMNAEQRRSLKDALGHTKVNPFASPDNLTQVYALSLIHI